MRRFIFISALVAVVGCGQQSPLAPTGERAPAPQMRPVADNYRVLYSFKGSPDGGEPGHGPLVALDGNLYGTTRYGGASGPGTVFEIKSDGSERVIYSFGGGREDGKNPRAGLVALNGALYGTTEDGGSGKGGYGTVFEVTKDGKERVVYNFDGYTGAYPHGALTDDAGVLYGTTNNYGKEFDGTLFALTTDGKFKVLYEFGRKGAGARPYAGPQFFRGKIYGTTLYGPADNDLSGLVYEQPVNGRQRFLHRFGVREGDGAKPYGRLTMLTGVLYGTTDKGGKAGQGTVFKLTTDGLETVLHSFEHATGSGSVAGLTAFKGMLIGETMKGGASDKGVIFEITPDGAYRVLHQFNGADGSGGNSELALWNGKLYGTTLEGGAHNHGTVFEISP